MLQEQKDAKKLWFFKGCSRSCTLRLAKSEEATKTKSYEVVLRQLRIEQWNAVFES